jgi:hypothetical protein
LKRKVKKSKTAPRKRAKKEYGLDSEDEDQLESEIDDADEFLPDEHVFIEASPFDKTFSANATGFLPPSSEDLAYFERIKSEALQAAQPFARKYFTVSEQPEGCWKVLRTPWRCLEYYKTHTITDKAVRKFFCAKLGWQPGDHVVPVRQPRTRAIAPEIVASSTSKFDEDVTFCARSGADEEWWKQFASTSQSMTFPDALDLRRVLNTLSKMSDDAESWKQLLSTELTTTDEALDSERVSRARFYREVKAERSFISLRAAGTAHNSAAIARGKHDIVHENWSELVDAYSDDFDGAYIRYMTKRHTQLQLRPNVQVRLHVMSYPDDKAFVKQSNAPTVHGAQGSNAIAAKGFKELPAYPCPVAHHHPAAWYVF